MKRQTSPEPRPLWKAAAALALVAALPGPLAGCSICSDYKSSSIVTIDRTLPMAKSQAATLTYQICVDRCVVVEPGDGVRFDGKVTLTEDGPNATKVHAEVPIDERPSTARVTFRASEGAVIRLEVVGNVPFTDDGCHTKATKSEL